MSGERAKRKVARVAAARARSSNDSAVTMNQQLPQARDVARTAQFWSPTGGFGM